MTKKLDTDVGTDASSDALVAFMSDVLRDVELYSKLIYQEYKECTVTLKKYQNNVSQDEYKRVNTLYNKFYKLMTKFSTAITQDYLDILSVVIEISDLRLKYNQIWKEYNELQDQKSDIKAGKNLVDKMERLKKSHDKLAAIYNSQIDKLDTFHKNLMKQSIIYLTNDNRKFVIPIKDYVAEFRKSKSDDTYKTQTKIIADHFEEMIEKLGDKSNQSPLLKVTKLEDINLNNQVQSTSAPNVKVKSEDNIDPEDEGTTELKYEDLPEFIPQVEEGDDDNSEKENIEQGTEDNIPLIVNQNETPEIQTQSESNSDDSESSDDTDDDWVNDLEDEDEESLNKNINEPPRDNSQPKELPKRKATDSDTEEKTSKVPKQYESDASSSELNEVDEPKIDEPPTDNSQPKKLSKRKATDTDTEKENPKVSKPLSDDALETSEITKEVDKDKDQSKSESSIPENVTETTTVQSSDLESKEYDSNSSHDDEVILEIPPSQDSDFKEENEIEVEVVDDDEVEDYEVVDELVIDNPLTNDSYVDSNDNDMFTSSSEQSDPEEQNIQEKKELFTKIIVPENTNEQHNQKLEMPEDREQPQDSDITEPDEDKLNNEDDNYVNNYYEEKKQEAVQDKKEKANETVDKSLTEVDTSKSYLEQNIEPQHQVVDSDQASHSEIIDPEKQDVQKNKELQIESRENKTSKRKRIKNLLTYSKKSLNSKDLKKYVTSESKKQLIKKLLSDERFNELSSAVKDSTAERWLRYLIQKEFNNKLWSTRKSHEQLRENESQPPGLGPENLDSTNRLLNLSSEINEPTYQAQQIQETETQLLYDSKGESEGKENAKIPPSPIITEPFSFGTNQVPPIRSNTKENDLLKAELSEENKYSEPGSRGLKITRSDEDVSASSSQTNEKIQKKEESPIEGQKRKPLKDLFVPATLPQKRYFKKSRNSEYDVRHDSEPRPKKKRKEIIEEKELSQQAAEDLKSQKQIQQELDNKSTNPPISDDLSSEEESESKPKKMSPEVIVSASGSKSSPIESNENLTTDKSYKQALKDFIEERERQKRFKQKLIDKNSKRKRLQDDESSEDDDEENNVILKRKEVNRKQNVSSDDDL